MASNDVDSALKLLKDECKAYSQKHKELYTLIKQLEIKNPNVRLKQDTDLKIDLDRKIIKDLITISTTLLETDQKTSKFFLSFPKGPNKISEKFKLLKDQLADTESKILKDLKSYDFFFSDFSSKLKSNLMKTTKINIKEKLVNLLSDIVHQDTIKVSLKGKKNFPVQLVKSFYLTSEEPELELNSSSENKFLRHQVFLTKNIEKIAEKLLKLVYELSIENGDPGIQEIQSSYTVTPSELKALKLKINRLHNRGSLTDEEARNVLGKISIIPTSPETCAKILDFKECSNKSFEYEDKVMSVKFKQAKAFEQPLYHTFDKKCKPVKRISKRSSTPAKKIIRNTSLPKSIGYVKSSSKDKYKGIKLKSKSPHSFI